MSSQLILRSAQGRDDFRPSEPMDLMVAVSSPVESLEVRVGWYTEGKGTEDSADVFVESIRDREVLEGRAPGQVRCVLPALPLSYAGTLIKIRWRAEATARTRDGATEEAEFPFWVA